MSLRLVMERGLGVQFDALVQKPVQNKTRQKIKLQNPITLSPTRTISPKS